MKRINELVLYVLVLMQGVFHSLVQRTFLTVACSKYNTGLVGKKRTIDGCRAVSRDVYHCMKAELFDKRVFKGNQQLIREYHEILVNTARTVEK